MSRNPHQRLPYGHPTQPPSHPQQPQRQRQQQSLHPHTHSQPQQHHQDHQSPLPHIGTTNFPPSTAPHSAQGHNLPQQHSLTPITHHIPMLARHPDPPPQPPAPPHQQSSGQEMNMFEVLGPSQTQNPALYQEPQDLNQPSMPHPAFPGATAQQTQLTDVYPQQPVHSRPQYVSSMWPPEHPVQSHQPHPQPPAVLQRPQPPLHLHQQMPKYDPHASAPRSVQSKRKRLIDPTPPQISPPHPNRETPVASTPKPPGHGTSTDTRQGKERVQRACTNCGEMNHIRKNKCSRCGTPKEPAKKRPRRQRKKKTPPQPQPASSNPMQASGSMSTPHRQGMPPEANVIAPVNRLQPFTQRQDPRQGGMQQVFDPRALTFQQGQPQASNTVQTHSAHALQRGQRQAPEFPLEPTFEENQGNFSHQYRER